MLSGATVFFHTPMPIYAIYCRSSSYFCVVRYVDNETSYLGKDIQKATLKHNALTTEAVERDLKSSLLEKLKDFLLELGAGFAFVGSQYHLVVSKQDYYLDLLFYHLTARCFVVVDLKITDFKPEYVGKMGFYLAVVDDQLRHQSDQPTIGLILCKTKNCFVAEYAVRNSQSPMGISEYRLAEALPGEIGKSLPSIEILEKKLSEAPFYYDVSSSWGYDVPPTGKPQAEHENGAS